jgi:hypothetical protein
MKPEHDRPLSTEDLARADEVRGHRSEPMRGDEAVLDRADVVPGGTDNAVAEPAAPATDREPRRVGGTSPDRPPLFPERDAGEFRKRWTDVQAGFVDEPRRAVEQADGLVADVMKRLAEGFAGERANLERQWDRGDNVTTEDLRIALQRYRSFFDRLLTV